MDATAGREKRDAACAEHDWNDCHLNLIDEIRIDKISK